MKANKSKKKIFFAFSTKALPLLLLFAAFSGCLKKGDDDPLISLKSRTNRISGKWKIAAIEQTRTFGDTTFEWSLIEKSGDAFFSINGKYYASWGISDILTIKNDGSFEETIIESGISFYSKGFWFFGHKNKKIDAGNKEIISFCYSSYKTSYPNFSITYTGIEADDTWYISRLSDKELVLHSEYSYYDSNNRVITMKRNWSYKKEKE